jgi:L-ascorbate metabolism protein UlaG (beta-lactamase superfamily)
VLRAGGTIRLGVVKFPKGRASLTNLRSSRFPLSRLLSLVALIMAAVTPAITDAQVTTTAAETQSPGLTVTYIAHCGFLFSSGSQKILVDALTVPSKEWPYDTPSPDLLQKMERGEPPFDHINVALISHAHIDHGAPASSVRFLLNNPTSVIVTTPEVRMFMEQSSPDFKKVQSRVVIPHLAWKQTTTLELNGVKLELARLKHGDDGQWACMVYAALFDMGGKKVLFASGTTGNFPEEYKTLDYAKRGIDLAFLYFDLAIQRGHDGGEAALNTAGIQEVRDLIGPKVTVLMHVEEGNKASVERLLPEVQKQLPRTIWFRHQLESQSF